MANYTILLIDYEPRSIERFRDPLLGAGYAIEIATDGVSGIEAFHRLNPDMVLVEAMIPKKHGFEVCQELKKTPHGQKTPVIITTGVYKGRKYRTQALHIYGCDEYIEKPIAPEQLLELVGKFLKPGSSGSAPKSTERDSEPFESGGASGSQNRGSAATKSVTTTSTRAPQATAESGTDDEIVAHLDAVFWSTGAEPSDTFEEPDVEVAAEVKTITAVSFQTQGAESEDPFAEIRAELNAVLGPPPDLADPESMDLTSASETIPSDELLAPSILEALPIVEPGPESSSDSPEAEVPIPPLPEPPSISLAERPGQVVDFDRKRSRKNKKPKHGKTRPDQAPSSYPAAQEDTSAPIALEAVASVAELTLPRGTVVESELEAPVASRGVPIWVWAVVGLIAVVGLYFVFSRDIPDRSEPSSSRVAPLNSIDVESSVPRRTPETVSPQPSRPLPAPAETPAPAVEAEVPQAPPAESQPSPAPKKQAERTSKPKAAAPVETRKNEAPVAPPSATAAAPRPAAVMHAAPDGLGVNVTGVETLPDPAATSAPALATGALIPIDEADTMPVPLMRRAPLFSELARQNHASDAIVLNVLINEKGSVDQAVLVTGLSEADLNDAAIRAAKTWTYRPAKKRGIPVKVWKSEQIGFKR